MEGWRDGETGTALGVRRHGEPWWLWRKPFRVQDLRAGCGLVGSFGAGACGGFGWVVGWGSPGRRSWMPGGSQDEQAGEPFMVIGPTESRLGLAGLIVKELRVTKTALEITPPPLDSVGWKPSAKTGRAEVGQVTNAPAARPRPSRWFAGVARGIRSKWMQWSSGARPFWPY